MMDEEVIRLGDDLLKFIKECFDESSGEEMCDLQSKGEGENPLKRKRVTSNMSPAFQRRRTKGIRLKIRQKYVDAFSRGHVEKLEDFVRNHISDDCVLTNPAVPEPLRGKDSILLFWKGTIAAIPDAIVEYQKLLYNESKGTVQGHYTFKGTKMFHRKSDILFTPKSKNCSSSNSDEKWSVEDVEGAIRDSDSSLQSRPTPPAVEGYQCPLIEYNVARGVETMYFNDENKISRLEYSYVFEKSEKM